MSAKAIHSSYAKGANAAAKALLGGPQFVFGDLQVAFTALTHKLYCHSRGDASIATGGGGGEHSGCTVRAWLDICLPHTSKLTRSAAFLASVKSW